MDFAGRRFYFVGVKGTGMASLAILLKACGAYVSGCDSEEQFSSDRLLSWNDITVLEGFSPLLLTDSIDIVIHSTAYHLSLPILTEAKRLGIPIFSYPQFLAHLSTLSDSYAVAGTHGKTTTVALTSYLLSTGTLRAFPFYSLFGSTLRGRSTPFFQGVQSALFEACEYQDHFLLYRLRGALITTVEYDHPDYFSSIKEVTTSFKTFVENLALGGFLICCSDNQGAKQIASYARKKRSDLTIMTYGFDDSGPFRIIEDRYEQSYTLSCLRGRSFTLPVKGRLLVGNFVGSVVLALSMILDRKNPKLYLESGTLISEEIVPTLAYMLSSKLALFPGVVGRLEPITEEGGVLYYDDYAHHPSEISTTLAELRLRYPTQTILVIFAPHTLSRTQALFKEFVLALGDADRLIVQSCYSSAREKRASGQDIGELLAKAMSDQSMRTTRCRLHASAYASSDEEAVAIASGWLQPQDLCITMGAGNNRALGMRIASWRRSL